MLNCRYALQHRAVDCRIKSGNDVFILNSIYYRHLRI